MELKDLKLSSVMYYVQSFTINAGGTSFEVPRSMIMTIDIDKFFDSMIYPMWYVCCNVPLWFYKEITKNVKNISVSMNLQYRLTPIDSNTEDGGSDKGSFKTEVSGNFKAVVPYTTQFEDATIQKQIAQENKEYNQNYTFNEYAIVELSLYNTAAYNASFNQINAVLTSTNMTDAFTYCINQAGISNILLSKADNNSSYREFKILPQSTIQNAIRIVEDYKFHTPGSILFFDLTEGYLVTKKIGCWAWKNNEYKSTHILSITEYSEGLSEFGGVFINSKEKTNVIAIPKDSFRTLNIDGAPQFTNTGETAFLTVDTKSALLSFLTPNKEFIVNCDSADAKKYNGKYRIYRVQCTMTPKGELLDPHFIIILRRGE